MVKKAQKDFMLFFCFLLIGFAFFAYRLSMGSFSVPSFGVMVLYLLAAPVCEEMFFRGFLQNYVKNRLSWGFAGVSLANLIVTVLFCFAHLFAWGISHSVLVFFPSIVFGYLYDRTGGLTYPILLHSLYNLNIFIL